MRIPQAAMPKIRLSLVIAFITTCVVFFGYLWTNMGGSIPGISKSGYRVSLELADADNLVFDSDVMVAGVRVGKVRKLEEQGGKAQVVMQFDDDAVIPLHEGATVQVRSKTLIEETYLEVVDGAGPEIPDDGSLPDDALKPSVQLDQVLKSLDKPTRASLGHALRSLGASTDLTADDIARTMTGLGVLGREGHDVLDALAAQSADLRVLVQESQKFVGALDRGRTQIVTLVDGADRITRATSASRADLEGTISRLPSLLSTTESATGSLEALSTALAPITKDLARSASPLNNALVQLPAVTRDLRDLLPSLDGTLDRAPKTLKAIPGVAEDLQDLVPTLRVDLADLNPMLAFLKPYGPELAAFFSTWTASLQRSDANGHYLRIFPVLNEGSLKGLPISLNHGFLDKSNAYPEPGAANNPGPFSGTYPHVERDPR